MRIFKLHRIAHILDGTFGVLREGEIPFCLTLEREWKDNKRGVSCIPVGIYTCKFTKSPKFGFTFEVTGVPGRSHILFHRGNIMDDTHGCIILGEEFGELDQRVAVLSSGRAFQEFMWRVEDLEEFELEVTEWQRNS